ncbi:MAG: hypothetical protein QXU71_03070 [Candidatus Aenigmatarchaeota archaeon]
MRKYSPTLVLLILILFLILSLSRFVLLKKDASNLYNIIDLTNVPFLIEENQVDNKEILNNLKNLCILINWSKRIIGGFFKGNWINADKIVEIFNGMRFKFKLYDIDKYLGDYWGWFLIYF